MLADFVPVQCDAVIANAVVDLMVCVIRDGLLGVLAAVLQFSVQVLSLKSGLLVRGGKIHPASRCLTLSFPFAVFSTKMGASHEEVFNCFPRHCSLSQHDQSLLLCLVHIYF